MTLGDKLSKKRKENNLTQEQLADILGVSRQAISKWESDIAYPETDKLIRISELFNCSLDYLLKDVEETEGTQSINAFSFPIKALLHERKSERMIRGMPLWHIGKKARGIIAIGIDAQGVIAIGLNARGVLSFGLLSLGLISFGMLSLGLISLGLLAIGILSAGTFAAGVFATGAICLGVISLGAVAIGDFSVGALAIGKYFALGDRARAMVALGDTEAIGSLFQRLGDLSAEDISSAEQALDSAVPTYLSWAKEIIKLFL